MPWKTSADFSKFLITYTAWPEKTPFYKQYVNPFYEIKSKSEEKFVLWLYYY